jgi:hypothetical protein
MRTRSASLVTLTRTWPEAGVNVMAFETRFPDHLLQALAVCEHRDAAVHVAPQRHTGSVRARLVRVDDVFRDPRHVDLAQRDIELSRDRESRQRHAGSSSSRF